MAERTGSIRGVDEVNRTGRFLWAWVAFAFALAIHVTDEAAHNFLSWYNPNVLAIRARFPFLPIPTFTFRQWILGLAAAVVLLLCLSPFASREARWLKLVAIPLGVIVGILNGLQHLIVSVYLGRMAPGALSGPILILAGGWLVLEARRKPEW
ncbi:MAG TPA: HXXEE domain-containing protein [Terriglobales bacterium]|nr:HXXEE domain-containing protein [Terriglobales bacterium]